jgi:hypothetical protein
MPIDPSTARRSVRGLIPAPFEFIGHQPILRIGRIELLRRVSSVPAKPTSQTQSPAIIVGLCRIATSLWLMSLRHRNVYRSIVTGLGVEL